MKVMDYVEREDRNDPERDWYQLDPDVVYPIALDELVKLVKGEVETPPYLARHVTAAKRLPADAFDLARVSFGKFPPERRLDRALALEGARFIFTGLLREQNGGPIGVHILKRENWRL